MKRSNLKVPGYRLHRASGQAVVTLNGKDHYLGRHGSAESRAKYDRLVGEWVARGRRPPAEPDAPAAGPTLTEVIVAYYAFADGHYRKDGKPTSQLALIKRTLKVVRTLYGKRPAAEFGPIALKAVRQKFIADGMARSTCNSNVARIKRMFRWAVEEEILEASAYHALQAVRGLAKGRTEAPDRPPVGPVPAEHVEKILPLLRAPVAAMVRLQVLSGMRPGEVCMMRGRDIDRTGPVWSYVPGSHKTEHRERDRIVLLGPKAQEVLRPWLRDDPDEYLFRPLPTAKSQGTGRRSKGRVDAGRRYGPRAYGARVREACRRAGVPPFSPNRLRHSAGTAIRQAFGLEAAQTVLGHARADVTELYAERDIAKAREIMQQIG